MTLNIEDIWDASNLLAPRGVYNELGYFGYQSQLGDRDRDRRGIYVPLSPTTHYGLLGLTNPFDHDVNVMIEVRVLSDHRSFHTGNIEIYTFGL